MGDEGTFDRLVKYAIGGVLALGAAKMSWDWLRNDAKSWLLDGVRRVGRIDVWGWVAAHPWWAAVLVVSVLFLVGGRPLPRGGGHGTASPRPASAGLVLTLRQLAEMDPRRFEQACAALLVRDGFTRVERVGKSGDLGADVIGWDTAGRKFVVQCKQYRRPVGSRDVQTFNGTARPEHGADVAVMVGLNGFTAPAAAFAARHALTLVGRDALEEWAGGVPLGLVMDGELPAA